MSLLRLSVWRPTPRVAGAIPLKAWEKIAKAEGVQARILDRSPAYPDNALAAAPHITPAERQVLVQPLMSPDGERATAKFRERYATGRSFVAASNQEYAGLGKLLAGEWGYN